ncbi:MAG: nuclear transport factor 2 family protein [Haloarculaceae archaeon]
MPAASDDRDMAETELARAYYRAIDDGDYDALADLLVPEFAQERPDRTLAGRERFVSFMREERPDPDTTHAVDAVFVRGGGVAVEGRLLRADGTEWFGFVDVFEVKRGAIAGLRTYTDGG